MRTPCTFCQKPSVARQLCKNHYRAFIKYGDAEHKQNLRGIPFELRYTKDRTTQCWLWIGGTSSDGYGVFSAFGEKRAHRVSWALHHGAIPTDLHVLHKCDTPSCVNPDHLFLGTHQDNMADLRAKGRAYGAKGEANFSALLTEAQAKAILADGRPASTIAIEYKISVETVSNIRNGKTWKHLFTEDARTRRKAAGPRRLNDTERLAIAIDPRTQVVIATEYGVTQGFVSAIKRKFYK